MAEAISGVLRGSVIGPILFVIYVNDLPDHLSADNLLNADGVKLIAPKTAMIFSKTPLTSAQAGPKIGSWTSTPPKASTFPLATPNPFVTYTLPSHNPPNTQTIPTVSTTKHLGIVLSTRLSAANKAMFYLKRSSAARYPQYFFPLYKTCIRPHLEYAIQATHPVLSQDAGALEKVQKLALKFLNGLQHVPYEVALKQVHLFNLTSYRIREGLIAMFNVTHRRGSEKAFNECLGVSNVFPTAA